jgi:hypothetical protein
MKDRTDSKDIFDQIIEGARLARKRLVEYKKRNGGALIYMENGKIKKEVFEKPPVD